MTRVNCFIRLESGWSKCSPNLFFEGVLSKLSLSWSYIYGRMVETDWQVGKLYPFPNHFLEITQTAGARC